LPVIKILPDNGDLTLTPSPYIDTISWNGNTTSFFGFSVVDGIFETVRCDWQADISNNPEISRIMGKPAKPKKNP